MDRVSDVDGILSVCLSVWLLLRIQLGGHIIKVQSYKLYGLEDICDTKHWNTLYEAQISFVWIDRRFRCYKTGLSFQSANADRLLERV